MRKTSKKLLVVFAIVFLLFLITSDKVFAETSEFSTSYSYSKEKVEQTLIIVNQKRAENGLGPLTWDYDLEKAATARAAESTGYFSHTRPDGNSCFTAIEELGIKSNYHTNGENIAYGYSTADDVMTGWMNSPGHRANILNPNYNTIGIACTGTVWVQLFGGAYDLQSVNSQKYIASENQVVNGTMKIDELYIEPVYTNLQANVGESKNASLCFVLRSATYPGVRFALLKSINANFSTDNNKAITFSDRIFTMNDYDTYKVIAEVGGKSASINIVGVKPDMRGYVFNSKYYADKYSDLKSAYGYNEAELKNHWETYGINEGRQASPVFSPKYYLDNNNDLKTAYGNNYRQAMEHFISFGASEGRKSSPEYSGKYYKNQYGDLSSFSYCKLTMHYYSFGYNEGRRGNDGAVEKPVVSQPNLAPQQPIQNSNSSFSGNINKTVFDPEYYRLAYKDLSNMDDTTLYMHWQNYGINEGRQASYVFNPKYYLDNNNDLRRAFGNNYKLALEHYITYGIKEGRKSSQFFDGKEYINKYSDLRRAYGNNYAGATEHFITFGINEGRVGSTEFNVNNYRQNYSDLNRAYGNSFIKYYNHYIAFGQKEGRIGV